jgi:hypothetical protein
MTTLTIHPTTDDQETAIRIFVDALHVDYKATEETDDTTYLYHPKRMQAACRNL